MKNKSKPKMETTKKKFIIHKYTVVQFDEEEADGKLFECIPDLWFVDENRKSCFFPPKTGKSYMQRAISCEKPEDNWGIYECTLVSGGHMTYHAGFKVVKEKCSQRYNTSSADEELQAAKFRREHPGLIGEGIEHIFLKPQSISNGTMVIDESSDGKSAKVVSKKTSASQRSSLKRTLTIDKCGDSENAEIILKKSKKSRQSTSKDTPTVNNCGEKRKIVIPSRERTRNEHFVQSTNSSFSQLDPNTESSRSAAQVKSKTTSEPKEISAIHSKSPSSFSIDSCRLNCSVQTPSPVRSSHSGSNHSRAIHQRSSHSRSSSQRSSHSRSSSQRSSHSRSSSQRSSHSRSRSQRSSYSHSRSQRSSQSSHPSPSRYIRSNRVRRSHSRSCSNSVQSSRPSRSRSNQSTRTIRHRPSYLSQICSSNTKRTENSGNKTLSVQRLNEQTRHLNQRNGKALNSQSDVHHSRFTNCSPVRLSSNSSATKDLITTVKELTKVVQRNNVRLTQNDRRLHRLEVTINKIFITVGDMNGNSRANDDNECDQGFNFPEIPIVRQTELLIIHKKLKDKEFRKCWLNQEKHFCCPTKTSTDTVTITKYLKRFISVNVRSQLTLKETGKSGITLYGDYHRVYLFLIDVLRQGYNICNKKITVDEAHTALRIVWGRSKQLQNDKNKRK